jgi:hypothetical protein
MRLINRRADRNDSEVGVALFSQGLKTLQIRCKLCGDQFVNTVPSTPPDHE